MSANTSPAASHETIVISNTPTLLNVNMSNVTKLTGSNFLMWSRQVHSLLDGYNLAGFVDGSAEIPPPTLTVDDNIITNDAYVLWKRQDKLIYSGLLGAISPSVQSLLASTTTSADIWNTLSATYAKPSRGHILQLRQQLKQWTKGTKSIDEYFQGLTNRFDQLALLEKPLDLEDKIEFILGGLLDEYKTMVEQIEGRDVSPTLTEIHEKLIQHELKLAAKSEAVSSLPVTANAASFRGNNNNRGRNNHRGNHNNWNNRQS